VEKYANVLNINQQLLLSEMELFTTTDTEVDINVIQEQLKEISYPQYYKIVQLALMLPEGSATAERSFSAMPQIWNCCDPPWDRADFLLWLSSILKVI